MCSHIGETVRTPKYLHLEIHIHMETHIHMYTHIHIYTWRRATYWGGPAARPRVLGSWAIKQLVAFLNLSIVLSAHCIHILLRILNIVLDRIVLYGRGCSANINCLTPGPTHGQTGHKAPGFIAPRNFGLLGTCYCRHRGFTISLLKPNTHIYNWALKVFGFISFHFIMFYQYHLDHDSCCSVPGAPQQ